MAKVEIQSAFVEEQVGSPVFVLKVAEPHSRKMPDCGYETTARTFYDVKASRESGIDLSAFPKGSRVKVWGTQKTEAREHQGKKFYTLVVWADRIEPAEAQHGAAGASAPPGPGIWPSEPLNGPENGFGDFGRWPS